MVNSRGCGKLSDQVENDPDRVQNAGIRLMIPKVNGERGKRSISQRPSFHFQDVRVTRRSAPDLAKMRPCKQARIYNSRRPSPPSSSARPRVEQKLQHSDSAGRDDEKTGTKVGRMGGVLTSTILQGLPLMQTYPFFRRAEHCMLFHFRR